jgi:uncharacterized membrane protein HdeD (DUF308 family)
VWLLVGSFTWSVWAVLLTGRLPAGQPQDESDERWSRSFLGGALLACGSVFLIVPDVVTRLLAAALVTGSVVLIASAFVPRLRRHRSN